MVDFKAIRDRNGFIIIFINNISVISINVNGIWLCLYTSSDGNLILTIEVAF
jgi:hypothetical protein